MPQMVASKRVLVVNKTETTVLRIGALEHRLPFLVSVEELMARVKLLL